MMCSKEIALISSLHTDSCFIHKVRNIIFFSDDLVNNTCTLSNSVSLGCG